LFHFLCRSCQQYGQLVDFLSRDCVDVAYRCLDELSHMHERQVACGESELVVQAFGVVDVG